MTESEPLRGRVWLQRAIARAHTFEGWSAFLDHDTDAARTYSRAVLAADGAFGDADAVRLHLDLGRALARFHEHRRAVLRNL